MKQDEIKDVAWVADAYVRRPVRGIVLAFHGLGFGSDRSTPTSEELGWAQAGGLVVFPYCGPWSWMNRETRAFVDDLVDAVRQAHALPADLPVIATGGSMGGCASLLYTAYTRHRLAGCLAVFPVCDLPYHFTERPDLPKTMRCAFRGYGDDFPAVLAEHSPLHQVARLPDVPYLVIHGDQDTAVNKAKHSDRLVAAMRARGLRVEYQEIAGMGHGSAVPLEVPLRQVEFVRTLLAR